MAHEDLYEQIEKRRSELLEDLERMRSERDEYTKTVNAKIRAAEDALDALPVPKTRYKRKPKPAEPRGITDPTPTYGDCPEVMRELRGE